MLCVILCHFSWFERRLMSLFDMFNALGVFGLFVGRGWSGFGKVYRTKQKRDACVKPGM